MKELIKIQTENYQQLVSARDLHKTLELKRHFGDWVKQNFKDFEEGTDFVFAPQSAPMPNGGVPKGTPVKGGNGSVQYLAVPDMKR